jgi:OHCU decarboxylase
VTGRLSHGAVEEVDAMLATADSALAHGWPGEPATRAPVHTLYVPADRAGGDAGGDAGSDAGSGIVAATRRGALDAVAAHAPDAATMAVVTGLPADVVDAAWPRVLAKLEREPVEDLRLDLEDGYGRRPDPEEDGHAVAAGRVLAGLVGPGRPFCLGVRVKSLEAATRHRSLRTLDLVLDGLVAAGGPPPGFVVTLPKVTSVDQVRAMVHLCERLESAYALPTGRLRFELQVETPQAVLGPDGSATAARALHAAAGRCSGLHFGTYDYSAALGIAPAHQALDHPAADHAKAVLQLAAAGTGVRVSDGSTNVLPVGDRAAVHAAWALHARLVRRSLERGFYQGWDLHPAQLPTRYLATYAFFRQGLAAAAQRLRAYVAGTAGGVLDEPATALALAGFLLRGLDCGALDADEVAAATGLDRAELDRLGRRLPPGLSRLNELPRAEARRALLGLCASARWADAVADGRPYRSPDDLQAAAGHALAALAEPDVDEALSGHPRIGQPAPGSEGAASRREQAGLGGADAATLEALAAGNRAYEARFGHVYLVCASGRSGEELLAVLRSRLGNDPTTERAVLRRELAAINRLRLDRLLAEGVAR